MVKTYGAIPSDWLSTKRRGPLRMLRAWDWIDRSTLAEIPPLNYADLILARMTWPQLTYNPGEELRL